MVGCTSNSPTNFPTLASWGNLAAVSSELLNSPPIAVVRKGVIACWEHCKQADFLVNCYSHVGIRVSNGGM